MTFWHALFTVVFLTAGPLAVLLGGLWLWIRHTDTGDAETFPEIMRVLGAQVVNGLRRFDRWLREVNEPVVEAPAPVVEYASAAAKKLAIEVAQRDYGKHTAARRPDRTPVEVWQLLANCDHYPMGMVSHAKEKAAA